MLPFFSLQCVAWLCFCLLLRAYVTTLLHRPRTMGRRTYKRMLRCTPMVLTRLEHTASRRAWCMLLGYVLTTGYIRGVTWWLYIYSEGDGVAEEPPLDHTRGDGGIFSFFDWSDNLERVATPNRPPHSRGCLGGLLKSPLLTSCARGESLLRSTGPCLSRLQTPLATCWLNVSGLREIKAFSMPQSWQSWIPQSRLQLRRKRSQQVQSRRPQAIT